MPNGQAAEPTCNMLSTAGGGVAAATPGCSTACEDSSAGSAGSASATASSCSASFEAALPGLPSACVAIGEDGAGALAVPFSRLTGTGGSDAGGTGLLPGALVGSADGTAQQVNVLLIGIPPRATRLIRHAYQDTMEVPRCSHQVLQKGAHWATGGVRALTGRREGATSAHGEPLGQGIGRADGLGLDRRPLLHGRRVLGPRRPLQHHHPSEHQISHSVTDHQTCARRPCQ